MKHNSIIAVDLGTSSTRAAVFEADGRVRGLSKVEYGVERPAPFMEEQQPLLIRQAAYKAIAGCLSSPEVRPEEIGGMAFSSQMYSVFPIDAEGNPLHNSMLWSDGRAESVAEGLRARGMHTRLYGDTACPVNSIYPLSKIIWLRENRPELFNKAARFVSIKDYVLFPLIQEWTADYSMASGTGMFSVNKLAWSAEALSCAGVDEERLPRLLEGVKPLPFKNTALADEWGLSRDIPIFLGGGDGPLANLGSGAGYTGGVNIDLGTSGAVRVSVNSPAFDPQEQLWCYSMLPGLWAYGGILTNVGNVFHWLAANLGGGAEAYAGSSIALLAGEAPAGADGLFFLPYLHKVKAPHWDDRLRGAMFGLTARHTLPHIVRAACEAVAYDLAAVLDHMGEQFALTQPFVLTGGFARSGVMPGIIADILGHELETPENCEGSLAGAALIALRGAGLTAGYAFERPNMVRKRFAPDSENHALYRKLREKFSSLVPLSNTLLPQ